MNKPPQKEINVLYDLLFLLFARAIKRLAVMMLDRFCEAQGHLRVLELQDQQPHDPDPGHEKDLPAVPDPK